MNLSIFFRALEIDWTIKLSFNLCSVLLQRACISLNSIFIVHYFPTNNIRIQDHVKILYFQKRCGKLHYVAVFFFKNARFLYCFEEDF